MLSLKGAATLDDLQGLHLSLRALLEASDGPDFDGAMARLERVARTVRVRVAARAVEAGIKAWLAYLATHEPGAEVAMASGSYLFSRDSDRAGVMRSPPSVQAEGAPLVIDGWATGEMGEALVVMVEGMRLRVDVIVRMEAGKSG